MNECGGFEKAVAGQTFASEPLTEAMWWRVREFVRLADVGSAAVPDTSRQGLLTSFRTKLTENKFAEFLFFSLPNYILKLTGVNIVGKFRRGAW